MNCTEFESVVTEIARGEIGGEVLDAAAHREGLAHAKTCERCAHRLANEQALSGLVAAIAAEDRALAPPPVMEKVLLAAFRERHIALRQRQHAWLTRAAVGAIAALLIVAGILAVRRPQAPRSAQVIPGAPTPVTAPLKVMAPVYRQPRKPPVRTLLASRRKPAPPLKAESEAEHREAREVVTEFMPVVYDPEPLERGLVVRVRLPRSALAAFGLPVNEQHAEEPIKADVVLGEDGLARAVRFVK
jgi:hypothetical protein